MITIQSRPSHLNDSQRGFTLIELSIVLVIIGLIVGGVLVGQDLIRAAGERAQISQIEKYQSAVATFYDKYKALPGDLNQQTASQFGFATRGTSGGEGDGNGVIQSLHAGTVGGVWIAAGELGLFWSDLTYANGMNLNLIPGKFIFNSSYIATGPGTNITGSGINNFFPTAAIGQGNYVYVWSGGIVPAAMQNAGNGLNYLAVNAITQINSDGDTLQSMGLTVKQAYDIDTKIDDGKPQTGRVLAYYTGTDDPGTYGAGTGSGWFGTGNLGTISSAGSSTTCYDNSNSVSGTPGIAGAAQHYSIEISAGSNIACALSFQFTTGD